MTLRPSFWASHGCHGSQVLSKLHFLKAAARLGFAKESKELWKALDKDDSGAGPWRFFLAVDGFIVIINGQKTINNGC